MSAIIVSMDKLRAGRALAAAGHPREVGIRLGAALRRANLTQADLVRLLDISSSQVSQWISGVNRPSLDVLFLALPHLGVSLQYVLIGDEVGLDYLAREELRAAADEVRAELAAKESVGPRGPGRPKRAAIG